MLGLSDGSASGEAPLTVRLNGEPCGPAARIELAKPCPLFPTYGFDVPSAAMLRGYNLVQVEARRACTIGWVEIALSP